MRTLTTVVLSLLAITGCAIQGGELQQSVSFATAVPQPATPPSTPSQQDNSFPRLVLPLTGGGPPVMAIPVGSGLYLPLTGGPVIPGIPITP